MRDLIDISDRYSDTENQNILRDSGKQLNPDGDQQPSLDRCVMTAEVSFGDQGVCSSFMTRIMEN